MCWRFVPAKANHSSVENIPFSYDCGNNCDCLLAQAAESHMHTLLSTVSSHFDYATLSCIFHCIFISVVYEVITGEYLKKWLYLILKAINTKNFIHEVKQDSNHSDYLIEYPSYQQFWCIYMHTPTHSFLVSLSLFFKCWNTWWNYFTGCIWSYKIL